MNTTTSNIRPHYAHVVELEGKIAAVLTSRAAACKYVRSIGLHIFSDGVNISKWNTTTGERVYGRNRLAR